MKTFKKFVAEAKTAVNVEASLTKYGFKNTADKHMGHKVYTPQDTQLSTKGIGNVFKTHGFDRVTHYARGGPDSRMPESGPHVYRKEHGYAGKETLEVHHEHGMVKHIIHSNSRSRD